MSSITQKIIEYVREHPGASYDDVLKALASGTKPGTIQNTLSRLAREGVLENRGEGVNRYKPSRWYVAQYKVIYNEDSSRNWSKDEAINSLFLRNIHRYMTDKLRFRGHLFLNEVLDELALPRTSEGQLKGWLYEDGREYSLWEEITRSGSDDIEIIFSVDGVIYDKIEGES